jgi:hypothetical protein
MAWSWVAPASLVMVCSSRADIRHAATAGTGTGHGRPARPPGGLSASCDGDPTAAPTRRVSRSVTASSVVVVAAPVVTAARILLPGPRRSLLSAPALPVPRGDSEKA